LIGFICLVGVIVFSRIVPRALQSLHALCRRAGTAKVETQRAFAGAFRRDIAVDLFCVVAAFGDGLRAGFEACLDLCNFCIGVLQRIDPVPFRRQPIDSEELAAVGLLAR